MSSGWVIRWLVDVPPSHSHPVLCVHHATQCYLHTFSSSLYCIGFAFVWAGIYKPLLPLCFFQNTHRDKEFEEHGYDMDLDDDDGDHHEGGEGPAASGPSFAARLLERLQSVARKDPSRRGILAGRDKDEGGADTGAEQAEKGGEKSVRAGGLGVGKSMKKRGGGVRFAGGGDDAEEGAGGSERPSAQPAAADGGETAAASTAAPTAEPSKAGADGWAVGLSRKSMTAGASAGGAAGAGGTLPPLQPLTTLPAPSPEQMLPGRSRASLTADGVLGWGRGSAFASRAASVAADSGPGTPKAGLSSHGPSAFFSPTPVAGTGAGAGPVAEAAEDDAAAAARASVTGGAPAGGGGGGGGRGGLRALLARTGGSRSGARPAGAPATPPAEAAAAAVVQPPPPAATPSGSGGRSSLMAPMPAAAPGVRPDVTTPIASLKTGGLDHDDVTPPTAATGRTASVIHTGPRLPVPELGSEPSSPTLDQSYGKGSGTASAAMPTSPSKKYGLHALKGGPSGKSVAAQSGATSRADSLAGGASTSSVPSAAAAAAAAAAVGGGRRALLASSTNGSSNSAAGPAAGGGSSLGRPPSQSQVLPMPVPAPGGTGPAMLRPMSRDLGLVASLQGSSFSGAGSFTTGGRQMTPPGRRGRRMSQQFQHNELAGEGSAGSGLSSTAAAAVARSRPSFTGQPAGPLAGLLGGASGAARHMSNMGGLPPELQPTPGHNGIQPHLRATTPSPEPPAVAEPPAPSAPSFAGSGGSGALPPHRRMSDAEMMEGKDGPKPVPGIHSGRSRPKKGLSNAAAAKEAAAAAQAAAAAEAADVVLPSAPGKPPRRAADHAAPPRADRPSGGSLAAGRPGSGGGRGSLAAGRRSDSAASASGEELHLPPPPPPPPHPPPVSINPALGRVMSVGKDHAPPSPEASGKLAHKPPKAPRGAGAHAAPEAPASTPTAADAAVAAAATITASGAAAAAEPTPTTPKAPVAPSAPVPAAVAAAAAANAAAAAAAGASARSSESGGFGRGSDAGTPKSDDERFRAASLARRSQSVRSTRSTRDGGALVPGSALSVSHRGAWDRSRRGSGDSSGDGAATAPPEPQLITVGPPPAPAPKANKEKVQRHPLEHVCFYYWLAWDFLSPRIGALIYLFSIGSDAYFIGAYVSPNFNAAPPVVVGLVLVIFFSLSWVLRLHVAWGFSTKVSWIAGLLTFPLGVPYELGWDVATVVRGVA